MRRSPHSTPPAIRGAGRAEPAMRETGAGVDATIAQIVVQVLPDFPPLDASLRGAVAEDVVAYVTRQVGSQPTFMRLPLQLALIGFQLLPLLRYGRRFGSLAPAQRAEYLSWW